MNRKYVWITGCFLLLAVNCNFAQQVMFLHHSIGNNLYHQGDVPGWIDNYNQIHGTSFYVDERSFPNTPWPWNNYPYDYWKLWIDGSCSSDNFNIECLNTLAANFDMIIIKHCAPGAAINADDGHPDITSDYQTLANYKLQYRALRSLFDSYPQTKFMVWTLAPLQSSLTTPEDSKRAYEFVQWVKNDWLTEDGKSHPNIYIFDFFSLVAELDPNPVNGVQYCLKYDYEGSHTDPDSHPNETANQLIGPIFAQAIVDAFSTKAIPVDSINVYGVGNESVIAVKGGTLQLSEEVFPADATNKNVVWSLQNITGQASIDTNGLVTAIADGTVIAVAQAVDGSGVSGSLNIVISNQAVPTFLTDESTNTYRIVMGNQILPVSLDNSYPNHTITLYNLLGNVVLTKIVHSHDVELNLSSISPGIYFLVFSDPGGIKVLKVSNP